MEELKPCSRCGNKPELILSDDILFKSDKRAYAYRCPVCSARTDASDSTLGAKKKWNKIADNDKVD